MIDAQPESVDTMLICLPIIIVMTGNILLYFVCWPLKDNSWIDVFWGITFVNPLIGILVWKCCQGEEIYARVILNFVIITVWALRLALHIGVRHKGEDFRYAQWRSEWMDKGQVYYQLRALTQVFIL